MRALKTFRLCLWALIAVTIALLAVNQLFPQWLGRGAEPSPPTPIAARGPVFDGGFDLLDHNGTPVTQKDFLGQPLVIFFGFTHCPDICPTTLSWLTALIDEIGPEAEPLRILFVTVDPERDDPAAMAAYVASFGPQVVGLTGSPEQVGAALKNWKVFAAKVPRDDGGYTMDHSASILLVDRQGRFRTIMDIHDQTPGANRTKLTRLLRDE